MELVINKQRRNVKSGIISDLLAELGLNKDMVAVELNKEIVHRQDFDSQKLSEHDELEIVTVVGGG